MHIGHISWLLSSSGGGIPPVVFALARAQSVSGIETTTFGVTDPQAPPLQPDGLRVELAGAIGPLAFGYALALRLRVQRASPDLLHLHGLFTWPSELVRRWRRLSGRPTVIAPHGMLEPWAMRRSVWKKRAFMAFIEQANLRGASCLHALNAAEARHIHELGFERPIVVLPNGVDLPPPDEPTVDARRLSSKLYGKRMVLFLGRVHPKKGLSNLVHAWAELRRDASLVIQDWVLVIAGPDQLGHRAEIEAEVQRLGIAEEVVFAGPLFGAEKEAALRAASAFVLPSYSEGFSVAVLEAMARGVPVLITRPCNFDEVATAGAGWVGEPTVESTRTMLLSCVSLSEAERKAKGARGRAMVERDYTWTKIAGRCVDVYRWLMGDSAEPDCVWVP